MSLVRVFSSHCETLVRKLPIMMPTPTVAATATASAATARPERVMEAVMPRAASRPSVPNRRTEQRCGGLANSRTTSGIIRLAPTMTRNSARKPMAMERPDSCTSSIPSSKVSGAAAGQPGQQPLAALLHQGAPQHVARLRARRLQRRAQRRQQVTPRPSPMPFEQRQPVDVQAAHAELKVDVVDGARDQLHQPGADGDADQHADQGADQRQHQGLRQHQQEQLRAGDAEHAQRAEQRRRCSTAKVMVL
jgi:hypothetical protein